MRIRGIIGGLVEHAMSPEPGVLFRLSPEEASRLGHPSGQGGFQQRLSDLASKPSPNGEITLTDEELGRIVRYCSYGSGGFQGHLRKIFLRSIEEYLHGRRQKP